MSETAATHEALLTAMFDTMGRGIQPDGTVVIETADVAVLQELADEYEAAARQDAEAATEPDTALCGVTGGPKREACDRPAGHSEGRHSWAAEVWRRRALDYEASHLLVQGLTSDVRALQGQLARKDREIELLQLKVSARASRKARRRADQG